MSEFLWFLYTAYKTNPSHWKSCENFASVHQLWFCNGDCRHSSISSGKWQLLLDATWLSFRILNNDNIHRLHDALIVAEFGPATENLTAMARGPGVASVLIIVNQKVIIAKWIIYPVSLNLEIGHKGTLTQNWRQILLHQYLITSVTHPSAFYDNGSFVIWITVYDLELPL